MTMKETSELSRRQFLGYSALGLTGLTISMPFQLLRQIIGMH